MEHIVEYTLLYDFYGEMLTPHQKAVYEAALFDDLSLAEIAQEQGISRQGVHDLIKRCNKILDGYEAKLHLVERFHKARKLAEALNERIIQCETAYDADLMKEIGQISREVVALF